MLLRFALIGVIALGSWSSEAAQPLLLRDSARAYIAPLDVTPSSFAAHSTRCLSRTYTGNVMDVTDSATGNTTGTRLICLPGGILTSLVSASACTFVTGNACSPLTTTCAVGCNAPTVYDQSGNSNCGAPCDVTEATNANRPIVVVNCQNGKICLQNFGAGALASAALSAAQAQPITVSWVALRTGSTAGINNAMGGIGANVQFGFSNAAATLSVYASSTFATTAASYAEGSPHAVQVLINGASSSIFVDSAPGTLSANPGTNGITFGAGEIFGVGGCPCNRLSAGNWFESIWWAGDKTADNAARDNTQRAYWRF